MVRLKRDHVYLEADGKVVGTLQYGYRLGTPYTASIEAVGGHIRVSFDDAAAPVVDLRREATDCYFKAGAYTQSNPARGDAPSAYGEVAITRLQVAHAPE